MIGKICLVGLLGCGMAIGQTTSAPVTAATRTAPVKSYRFEVVSIRQNLSEMQGDLARPTADGYRMTNSWLQLVMNTAYVPQTPGSAFYSPGQVKGLPEWLNTERYDIDARISDEDRASWQNPAEQKAMLPAMLQAMLVERCKLVVHCEVKYASVYSLVAGKDGIKFKDTDPTVDPPSGQKLPWGGVLVSTRDSKGSSMSFYGTSMASLSSLLSNILSSLGQHEGVVQDKTGLTGRYDFVIKFPLIEPRVQGEGQGAPQADDPSLMAFTAAKQLGLKLESTKGQVETLVIDHMERPSQN
jgi:bla regulator protein blaR1